MLCQHLSTWLFHSACAPLEASLVVPPLLPLLQFLSQTDDLHLFSVGISPVSGAIRIHLLSHKNIFTPDSRLVQIEPQSSPDVPEEKKHGSLHAIASRGRALWVQKR